MGEIDYWRQLDIFSPSTFKLPVKIIGVGAVGSHIAWQIGKIGCRDITIYDFDKVEAHNVPNQMYWISHVGMLKVDAMQTLTTHAMSLDIDTRAERFENQQLKGIVFVVTDSMESRKAIWRSSIKNRLGIEMMVETRMGPENGRIFAISPFLQNHINEYEKTLYSDEEAEESPCTNRAISPVASAIADIAVYRLIDFARKRPMVNEIFFSMSPPYLTTKKY